MGFWNFFSSKLPQTGDEFFGALLFREDVKDPAKNYFECQRIFAPSGKMIEIALAGQLSGPTQPQKDFFRQLEIDYFLLIARLKEAIEQAFSAWMKLPVIQNFEVEFRPTYLSIPTCEEQPVAWEITFDTVHDLNHIVTVEMLGYEPQYVRVDG